MTEREERSGARPRWPAYLEPLRPDAVTAHRIRRGILTAAEALIQARARSWFEITAGWSAALAPLAAGVLVVFGTLAYRAAVPVDHSSPVAAAELESPPELVRSLAPDAVAPPALLIDMAEPTRDALLAAALIIP